ncbi:hypothetical protein, partial [Pseudoalteromonas luteoviolacea]|uniref:hypothetical protein n=1 Tax=Pseudoalteromonas luteoviolacea TaxID=43657 RepID=UPI000A9C4993
AGDSFGGRPDDFEPFPTGELNQHSYTHHGVLYIEKDTYHTGDYYEYMRICVKANDRMILGAQSQFDENARYDKYVLQGTYHPTSQYGSDYGALTLKLNSQHYQFRESITLFKYAGGKYEFEGYTIFDGNNQGTLRAYYKGSDNYIAEGCENSLGTKY